MGLTKDLGSIPRAITVDSSNRVGIGTVSPSYNLDLTGSFRSTTNGVFGTSKVSNGAGLSIVEIYGSSNFGSTPAAELRLYQIWNGLSYPVVLASTYDSTSGPASSTFTISTTTFSGSPVTSERMRIVGSNGNVGIGTTSPGNKLVVQENRTDWASIFTNNSNSLVAFAHGSGFGMAIDSITNSWGTYLFKVAGGNGTSMGTNEYFKISGSGALYSLPTFSNTSGSGANLGIASDGFFYRSTSSLKYKKNVEDYAKGLNEIMQMRPVTYNSINESEEGIQYAGLIAEEIHDLGLTEFVQYAEDNTPDALSYANMVSLLVKGIQEQQQTIQELTERISVLENK